MAPWRRWGLCVAFPQNGNAGRQSRPVGVGECRSGIRSIGISVGIKASTSGKNPQKRQAGRGPGEPCRCDKLKISTAAHRDALHRLLCRWGFVSLPAAAAAVTTCGTLLTHPPALLEQRSQCPCHDTRPAAAPQPPSLPGRLPPAPPAPAAH